MSFILDALKKSENDRQRQSGPALFEVRVAPPRTRLPFWAIVVGLLLAINVGVISWIALRRPAESASSSASARAELAPAATAGMPGASVSGPAPVSAPQPAVNPGPAIGAATANVPDRTPPLLDGQ